MMNKLWTKRLKKYQKLFLHYSRFVLNDHFVLALLFFVGGLGLGYSNFLRSLPSTSEWWSKPLMIVVLVIVLQFGSFISLLDEPDTIFLLPLESKMIILLKQAFKHSYLIAALFQSVCFLLAVPFLQKGLHLTGIEMLLLWLVQLLLKAVYLERFLIISYAVNFDKWWIKVLCEIAGPILILIVALYGGVIWALLLTLFALFTLFTLAQRATVKNVLRWKRMLQIENQRMMTLYRFINLFTDVPQVKGKVHRFRLFDAYLPKMKTPKDVFKFLYWRALVRKGEYSSLYLRLTLLGVVVLIFVPNLILTMVLLALFLYLIGFQLLPLYNDHDDIVFTHIYPLKRAERLANFRWVLRVLLLATGVLLVGASAFAGHSMIETMEISAVAIIMIVFLTGNFLTKYAAKSA